MKLQVKQYAKYSLHVVLPKKLGLSIKNGDFIEVDIGEKTPTTHQSNAPELESRVKALEDFVHPIQKVEKEAAEAKTRAEAAKKAEELRIANRQADDGGFS